MKYIILVFISLSICGCKFNPPKAREGISFLQGNWIEDSILNNSQLVSYQQYQIRITADSFYLRIENHVARNLNGGPCFQSNTWQEFAKGYYKLNKDTLKLEGNFVNQSYKYKPEGSCYRSGKYLEDFVLNKKTNQSIEIKSLQTGLHHQLKHKAN